MEINKHRSENVLEYNLKIWWGVGDIITFQFLEKLHTSVNTTFFCEDKKMAQFIFLSGPNKSTCTII